MFPSYVTSVQDQFIAVLINLIGTVLGGAFNSFISTFMSNLLGPFLEQFAPATGA